MLTDAVPGRRSRALPIRFPGARGAILLVILAVLGQGCLPDAFLSADEDRDRNFQRARDAERLGDFAAAAEHYERALDRNPRMPAVHLGYATLSEFQLRRYADAVYHYQRYLRLRPDDPKADDIRHRITNCTERLATSVPLVIRSETIARDLESVRGENHALRVQVSNLVATAAYWSNEWRRLTAVAPQLPPAEAATPGTTGLAGASPGAASNAVAGAKGRPPAGRAGYAAVPGTGSGTGAGRGGVGTRAGTGAAGGTLGTSSAGAIRYHRVAPGETMESIARRYGITGAALRRANPQVEPRRMRSGIDLRIPPR
jgi:tetratricopeptide (TPR) repeat protein